MHVAFSNFYSSFVLHFRIQISKEDAIGQRLAPPYSRGGEEEPQVEAACAESEQLFHGRQVPWVLQVSGGKRPPTLIAMVILLSAPALALNLNLQLGHYYECCVAGSRPCSAPPRRWCSARAAPPSSASPPEAGPGEPTQPTKAN